MMVRDAAMTKVMADPRLQPDTNPMSFDAAQSPTPTAKATRREWIGLAVIALPCLVYAMDLTVLNLALPALSAALKPSSSQLLWIADIYGFLVAGFLIPMGTLGDRIGRRKLLLIGAAMFGSASIVAAFSNSVETLIAMRALLGIAGATLAPSTMSLIRNMFHDEHERQFAVGVWIASFSLGAAIGPLVGGVLLQFFWWGSVFLVAVPVMTLLILVAPTLLPEYRDVHARPLDLASVVLSLLAVLTTVYGLKQIAQHGIAWVPALLVIAGLAVGALFVRRQGRDVGLLEQAVDEADVLLGQRGRALGHGPGLFHLVGQSDVQPVGPPVGMVVDPAQLLLELLGIEAGGAQHAHAARLGRFDDDVAAVREGEDRRVEAEHVGGFGTHRASLAVSGR